MSMKEIFLSAVLHLNYGLDTARPAPMDPQWSLRGALCRRHPGNHLADAEIAIDLVIISFIRHRFVDTPFLAAAFRVVVGGALVFVAGILIGRS
jgi:hypothetical protein